MKSILVLSLLLEVAVSGSMVMAQSPGTFTATGNLTTERMFHAATLLTNGQALIAGGFSKGYGSSDSSVWDSAELYNPSTGTFAATGNMTTPRYSHTATLLPDGKVLIAGGGPISADFRVSLILAELYDPATGTFTATGDMTTARSWHTATLLNNGKVLIAGGSNGPLASAELYDPLSGTFTAAGRMLAPRDRHVAVLLPNGKVLIAGGNSCGDGGQPNPELYDPATGEFTLTGPSAFPPSWGFSALAASLLPSGNVLATLDVGCDVFGGAEVYDSLNGTFAETAKMTADRGYNTTTLLPEGRVLIAGRDWARIGGSAELYDPVTGTFSTVGNMLGREEGHTATLLPDGTVLMAGGWVCCGYSIATAKIYRPAVLVGSPVLFLLGGGVQGAIFHSATHQVVSSNNPAIAGEALEIYLTGLTVGSLIPPQVAIGGRMAEVLFFGKAPRFANLNQVNVRVPSAVPPGPAVPVRLNYLNRPSNAVTIGVK